MRRELVGLVSSLTNACAAEHETGDGRNSGAERLFVCSSASCSERLRSRSSRVGLAIVESQIFVQARTRSADLRLMQKYWNQKK